jgi:hypothetical protein
MRYKENKTAIIIDHIANVYTHGFPDDVREWSLDSKKKKEQSKVKVRECPICFMCLPGMAKECTECGYVFTKEEQEERETVEAELKELQKTDILRRKPHDHYRNIKTFDDMQMFQKAKGYKFAWVLHKCMELNITIPAKYDFMLRRYIS